MEMGSRDGGWDVFGCVHLVERISPGFFVKVDWKAITFGQAVQFRACGR